MMMLHTIWILGQVRMLDVHHLLKVRLMPNLQHRKRETIFHPSSKAKNKKVPSTTAAKDNGLSSSKPKQIPCKSKKQKRLDHVVMEPKFIEIERDPPKIIHGLIEEEIQGLKLARKDLQPRALILEVDDRNVEYGPKNTLIIDIATYRMFYNIKRCCLTLPKLTISERRNYLSGTLCGQLWKWLIAPNCIEYVDIIFRAIPLDEERLAIYHGIH
ncbi:hypothetical protein KP509_24G023900 [Ceratopteris richardii]|uniref:Uncharacterized protein n=1 Tax=Ceratopteris richardii TaxID=49495 RepID=A0A8T2RTX8_CERRI|nr:hypothetical protein KP509_24G023900 [Ceratopteris richardii]